jgi:hypothetical protein
MCHENAAHAGTTPLAEYSSTPQHSPVNFRSAFLSAAAALSFGVALLLSPSAWANCSGPVGQEGMSVYAGNVHTMVYCDGSNWISMAGGVSLTVGGSVTNNNATAAGSTSEIQYNAGSSTFGSSGNFTYSAGLLTVTGTTSTTNLYASNISGGAGTFGALTVNGVAITGSSAGDRISTSNVASGANLGMAVAGQGTISFTLAGTAGAAYINSNLGFVGPGVSTTGPVSATILFASNYVSAPLVSSTNVSMTNFTTTTGNYQTVNVTTIKGGGGNYIVSSTASVSTTTAGGGNVNFSANGTLAMTISGTNVGIGTAIPNTLLDLYSSGQSATNNPGNAALQVHAAYGSNPEFLNVGYDPTLHVGYIQPVRTGAGGTYEPLILNPNGGYVGIGMANPARPLNIKPSVANTPVLKISQAGSDNGWGMYSDNSTGDFSLGYDNAGTYTEKFHITNGGNATLVGTLTQNSDARLKSNIHPIASALDKLASIHGVTFNWKDKNRDPREQIGVIAQDVQKTLPQLVTADASGTLSVNYNGLVAPLIEAVHELKADNDNLRHEFETYKAAHP